LKNLKTIIIKDKDFIPDKFTSIVEYSFGRNEWFKEDFVHRLNSPQIEYLNEEKE